MTLDELRSQNREAIMAIAARHGVTGIRVFGSFARGEAGPVRTPFFPGGLVTDLEEALGMRIDVTTSAGLHPMMREHVLREAVFL